MRTFFVFLLLLLLASVGVLWYADALPSLDDLLGEKRVKDSPQAKKAQRTAGEFAGPDANVSAAGPLSAAGGKVLYDPITIPECTTGAVVEGDVPSQVEGVLEYMFVDLGRQVVADETLVAKVDDISIQHAEREAAVKASNDLPAKTADKKKDEFIHRSGEARRANAALKGTVSDQEWRTLELQAEAFDFEAQGHRKELQAAGYQWERIKRQLELHKIKSAISGEVIAVYKKKGESVKAQDAVCRVANFDRLRIEGLVDRRQVGLLRPGMRALVQPVEPAVWIRDLSGHTGRITGLAVTPDDGRYLASASEDGRVSLWNWRSGGLLQVLPHHSEVYFVVCDQSRKTAPYQFLTGCNNARAFVWHVPVGGQITKTDLHDAVEGHSAPVRCGAFHPNGKWCATGGDDRRICVWNLADGKLAFRVESVTDGEASAHRGAVTALHFTPDGRLVSAGQDNVLRVWKLGEAKAESVREQGGRTGEVARLGVSRDGRRALFDHGDELRLLDLDKNLNTVGSIRNRGQELFRGLAAFSTSGRLVLSSVQGQAQLWSVPATPDEAAFFRQGYERGFYHHSPLALGALTARLAPAAPLLMPQAFAGVSNKDLGDLPGLWRLSAGELRHVDTAVEISCAAFTPDDDVMFTGDTLIRVWRVPSTAESTPLEAIITYVADEVGQTGVKVRAELDNPRDPDRRLRAGTKVNLTLYPETAPRETQVSRQ